MIFALLEKRKVQKKKVKYYRQHRQLRQEVPHDLKRVVRAPMVLMYCFNFQANPPQVDNSSLRTHLLSSS